MNNSLRVLKPLTAYLNMSIIY